MPSAAPPSTVSPGARGGAPFVPAPAVAIAAVSSSSTAIEFSPPGRTSLERELGGEVDPSAARGSSGSRAACLPEGEQAALELASSLPPTPPTPAVLSGGGSPVRDQAPATFVMSRGSVAHASLVSVTGLLIGPLPPPAMPPWISSSSPPLRLIVESAVRSSVGDVCSAGAVPEAPMLLTARGGGCGVARSGQSGLVDSPPSSLTIERTPTAEGCPLWSLPSMPLWLVFSPCRCPVLPCAGDSRW